MHEPLGPEDVRVGAHAAAARAAWERMHVPMQGGVLVDTLTDSDSLWLTGGAGSAPLAPVTAARRMYADVAGGHAEPLRSTRPFHDVSVGRTGDGAASSPLAPVVARKTAARPAAGAALQGSTLSIFDGALTADFLSAPLEAVTAARRMHADLAARAAEGLDPAETMGWMHAPVTTRVAGTATGGALGALQDLTVQRRGPQSVARGEPGLDTQRAGLGAASTMACDDESDTDTLDTQTSGESSRLGGGGTNDTNEVVETAERLVLSLRNSGVVEVAAAPRDAEAAAAVVRVQEELAAHELEQTRQRLIEMQRSLEARDGAAAGAVRTTAAEQPAGGGRRSGAAERGRAPRGRSGPARLPLWAPRQPQETAGSIATQPDTPRATKAAVKGEGSDRTSPAGGKRGLLGPVRPAGTRAHGAAARAAGGPAGFRGGGVPRSGSGAAPAEAAGLRALMQRRGAASPSSESSPETSATLNLAKGKAGGARAAMAGRVRPRSSPPTRSGPSRSASSAARHDSRCPGCRGHRRCVACVDAGVSVGASRVLISSALEQRQRERRREGRGAARCMHAPCRAHLGARSNNRQTCRASRRTATACLPGGVRPCARLSQHPGLGSPSTPHPTAQFSRSGSAP